MLRNMDQLRYAIDTGRTGDKVAFGDPAAAPLGTDEEAAGTAPSAAEFKIAQADQLDYPGASGPMRESTPRWWLAIVAVSIVTAAVALFGARFYH